MDVVTTMRMAEAAVAAGAKEAVLLDSGFSTSVVYNGKIIVTGHTARDVTSRPVPHAIVFTGELSPNLDPETKAFFDQSGSSLTVAHDESYYRTSTHRRHRRHPRE